MPGIVLLENAGAGAARMAVEIAAAEPERYPDPFIICCGPGNNGGDGYVIARHLYNAGFQVAVRRTGGAVYPPGSDAGVHFEIIRRMKLEMREPDPSDLRGPATVIDALFGTGLSRPLRSPYLEWVQAINASGLPVIALDIPSGLDANSGEILGDSIRALHTITFAAPKVGFYGRSGPERCGAIHVVDIGIPREIWRGG